MQAIKNKVLSLATHYLVVLLVPVLGFFSLSAYATVTPAIKPLVGAPAVASTDTTYFCERYTKNIVFKDRSTTDTAPIEEPTTVIKTKEGYTVKSGSAFSGGLKLVNAYAGSMGNLAGDDTTLLAKNESDEGHLYFVIYTFEAPKVKKDGVVIEPGATKNLYVLASCTIKE